VSSGCAVQEADEEAMASEGAAGDRYGQVAIFDYFFVFEDVDPSGILAWNVSRA
jgi:hypothetical protein